MLQRVQTIFLTLVFIAMIVAVLSPLWQKFDSVTNGAIQLTAINLTQYEDFEKKVVTSQSWTFYIALIALIAAGVAAYSATQYKKRLTQIKLGALNSLLMGGSLILTIYFSFQGEKMLEPEVKGAYLPGFYAIFVALIFNLLANRFIRRDERLVRSVDRIR